MARMYFKLIHLNRGIKLENRYHKTPVLKNSRLI